MNSHKYPINPGSEVYHGIVGYIYHSGVSKALNRLSAVISLFCQFAVLFLSTGGHLCSLCTKCDLRD